MTKLLKILNGLYSTPITRFPIVIFILYPMWLLGWYWCIDCEKIHHRIGHSEVYYWSWEDKFTSSHCRGRFEVKDNEI